MSQAGKGEQGGGRGAKQNSVVRNASPRNVLKRRSMLHIISHKKTIAHRVQGSISG